MRETRRIRRDRDRNRDRDRDRGFHPRAGGGRTREKVKERGGCAGSIVCGVNVLLDSDQRENRFSDCATSLVPRD